MDNAPFWLEPLPLCERSPPQCVRLGDGTALFLHTPLHDQILAAKNTIDDVAPAGQWDDVKKITNSYEYVFLSLLKRQHRSIANIAPLSRSYFKMIELWDMIGLKDIPQPMMTAHTAEGPGGFLEAIQDRTAHRTPMYAMTLRSTERTIPGWRKSQQFLTRHPTIKILYGPDDTGNIYHLANQEAFAAATGGHADLYTADGGFDFSADFNGQETTVQRLLIAEALAGLRALKVEGTSTMILKMFDTKHRATLEIIWLLSICFDRVAFVKPHTSRPANSERYWIGRGYRGAPAWVLDLLRTLTATAAPNGWSQLFAEPPWPPSWLETVSVFQRMLELHQLSKIQLTLSLIQSTTREQIAALLLENIRNSRVWCQRHTVPINPKYAHLSDSALVSLNLEEALAPFQVSDGRTRSPESSRQLLTHHGSTAHPVLRTPTVPAWRSALPPSVRGVASSRTDEGTPPSTAP
jgi:hypothetical protein